MDKKMNHRHRILIVDDEPASCRLQERLLHDTYRLMSVPSGEKALAAVPLFQPDLILLDVAMPGLDGYETCRCLRAMNKENAMKILFVSGHDTLAERIKGYEAGADDYVTKPFDLQEFRAKVDAFVNLRLDKKNLDKEPLLSLISQESRMPLNVIIGLSELIMGQESLPEEIRQKNAAIYQSAVSLHHFLEKATLLHYLKNGMTLPRYGGSLRQHLDLVIMDARHVAEKRNVQLVCHCFSDIELPADWQSLDVVLGYLIDNAVKFTTVDSTVTLTAGIYQETCFVRVADQGPGIDPFWFDHLSNEAAVYTHCRQHHGQGLSLAIAHAVITRHGGELHVDGTPGEGATFTLTLPLKPPSVAPQPV